VTGICISEVSTKCVNYPDTYTTRPAAHRDRVFERGSSHHGSSCLRALPGTRPAADADFAVWGRRSPYVDSSALPRPVGRGSPRVRGRCALQNGDRGRAAAVTTPSNASGRGWNWDDEESSAASGQVMGPALPNSPPSPFSPDSGLDNALRCSAFVLMEVETLGVARSLGWKVHMRCGYRKSTRSMRRCV
jgi:hypothetical protein